MDTSAPQQSPPAPPRYVSATQPNWRELALSIGIAVVLLLPFPLVWLALESRALSGMKLDTFKALPEQAQGIDLLPTGAGFGTPSVEENRASVIYTGGGIAQVNAYADHKSAVREWSRVWLGDSPQPNVSVTSTLRGAGLYLARGIVRDPDKAEEIDGYFVTWVNGPFEFWLFGGNRQKLDSLIKASTFIDAPDERSYGTGARPLVWTVIDEYPWAFALALELAILAFMWGIFSLGIWLGTRRPPRGSSRASRDELIDRLLGLNHPDSPFVVERVGANHLICRWKLDLPEVFEMFRAEQRREIYQIDLYIRPYGTVAALETHGRALWNLDNAAGSGRSLYRWDYFRGIVLAGISRRASYSYDPLALRFVPFEVHQFDINAYKRPIVQTVLASGWIWRPILFRPFK